MYKVTRNTCPPLLVAFLLAACGGGGGGGGENTQLPNPNLAFSETPPPTLAVDDTHTFEVSTESNAPITWSIDDITRAEIEPTTGKLTAKAPGIVKVTVRVEAGDTNSGATLHHTLTISEGDTSQPLQDPNLAFTETPPPTLEINATHTFAATRAGDGAITYSVTADGSETDLATIDDTTGLLTANKAGAVKVIASVAETATHSAATIDHTVEITRREANLILSTFSTDYSRGRRRYHPLRHHRFRTPRSPGVAPITPLPPSSETTMAQRP